MEILTESIGQDFLVASVSHIWELYFSSKVPFPKRVMAHTYTYLCYRTNSDCTQRFFLKQPLKAKVCYMDSYARYGKWNINAYGAVIAGPISSSAKVDM